MYQSDILITHSLTATKKLEVGLDGGNDILNSFTKNILYEMTWQHGLIFCLRGLHA